MHMMELDPNADPIPVEDAEGFSPHLLFSLPAWRPHCFFSSLPLFDGYMGMCVCA